MFYNQEKMFGMLIDWFIYSQKFTHYTHTPVLVEALCEFMSLILRK